MTRSRDTLTLEEARERAAISPKQAGALLGLGKNAVYAGIHRGEIPSYVVGGRIIVPVQALLERLERGPLVTPRCLPVARPPRRPSPPTYALVVPCGLLTSFDHGNRLRPPRRAR